MVPEGAELSQRTLDALDNWGVEVIQIEGDEAEYEPDSVEIEAAIEELAWRFEGTDVTHPLIQTLMREAAKTRLRTQAETPQPVPSDVP